jgi:hypothetical protein
LRALVLATLATLVLAATPALADPYGPVVGVLVQGTGVASGADDPAFVAPAAFSHVTVNVTDDVGQHTYFSACVETTGDTLCSKSDPNGADLQASGFDSVTLDVPGGATLPAGTSVTVFVYTIAVGGALGDTTVGIGTTGTATATFS